MSGSDDSSDFMSESSPYSQYGNSPYSSPSQQVPKLANGLFSTNLSCADNSRGPYLYIIEEPMNHFRFRYKSEMIGTHGCLLGKSNALVKTKTHPTVELKNYNGSARIRCSLVRHDNAKEHPHKLQDDQDRDVSSIVPETGSYKVAFSGMGIIHTAKKDVAALLFQKYLQDNRISSTDENRLRVQCEKEAREINLNIVRLKFSAHDLMTNKEVCPPIFSQPIHNLKSAATNDLKICRMSRSNGRACGGDDVFLLVEKVKKSNIMIRFFELDDKGERTWTAKGSFMQADVHHQYAIVFRTPPYKDTQIKSDVDVYIELVRPSDGRTSEPKSFRYNAHPIHKQSKKRKVNSSFSSLESNSSSLKSSSEYPVTISFLQNQIQLQNDEDIKNVPNVVPQVPEYAEGPANDILIGDAIFNDISDESMTHSSHGFSPMLCQPTMPELPQVQLNSSEIARLIESNTNISTEEKQQFLGGGLAEYFNSFSNDFPEMNFNTFSLVADSGRPKETTNISKNTQADMRKNIQNTNQSEYAEFYKAEDGVEVKQLVKEICEIIRTKTGHKKQTVKAKLERLFEMRLSNGDTFLHMTLCTNQPSLQYIIKLIHNMKLDHLLNIRNNQMRSILHQAIINDAPKIVTFFISKGCDPMIQDAEGNNAIHYAVICQSCLGPLLGAIKRNDVSCDLNAYNNEKHSALHLACQYGSAKSVQLLAEAGASLDTRDDSSRTPLHLAVLDDCLPVVRTLLDVSEPSDINAVDDAGYTALQMVCDAPLKENTLEILKLLLEKKADPMKQDNETKHVWKLSRNKPEVLEILKGYVSAPPGVLEDDVKSEPEDEYESADEGDVMDNCVLPELNLYMHEVARLLDRSGAWRELARRVHRDTLQSWYAGNESPTTTLLNHIKLDDDVLTSKSLALILEDIGEMEAASVIRNCISD